MIKPITINGVEYCSTSAACVALCPADRSIKAFKNMAYKYVIEKALNMPKLTPSEYGSLGAKRSPWGKWRGD